MKKGFTLIELIVVIAIVLILAAILFPVFSRGKWPATKSSCMSNLKQVGLGFLQYTNDYDGLYPRTAMPIESSHKTKEYPDGVYGWADVLQPYLKSTVIYQCPTEGRGPEYPKPQNADYTDYWFNSRLAETNSVKLKKPISIILSGDGNDGGDLTDATYSYGSLPGAWIDSKSSPAYRHVEQGDYLFADGHVKAFAPDKIDLTPPDGKNYTFRIQ
jgi:prepilin-type N-terminal cleavage/methylation domain-containing protein/prepilin-type processing-associated H-X9-DG protein